MNLSNTVDVLNSAMKTGGKLLGQSGKLSLAGSYGKIASDIFNSDIFKQAMDKGPQLLDKLGDRLESGSKPALLGSGVAALNLPALATPSAASHDSVNQAMDLVREWDDNQDGVLSRDELQQGLWKLDRQIGSQTQRAEGGDAYETAKLGQYREKQAFAQKLMDGYDTHSQWDNQAGISVADIKLMAFQDGNPNTVSQRELALSAYKRAV